MSLPSIPTPPLLPSPTSKKAVNSAPPADRGGQGREEPHRISFAIYGSFKVVKLGDRVSQFRIERDPTSHPIPKLKKTGGQFWTPEAKRYVAWKAHIVSSFLDGLKGGYPSLYEVCARRVAQGAKPIPSLLGKAYMTVFAYYHNHKHPDTENVLGAIADALFENDSKLAGTFDYSVASEHVTRDQHPGSVSVTITIDPDTFSQPFKEPRAPKSSSNRHRNVWQTTRRPRSPRSPGRTRS